MSTTPDAATGAAPVEANPKPKIKDALTPKHRVVIIGSGFGGLTAAKTLKPVSYTHLTLPTICSV